MTENQQIKVVLTDDHCLVRNGLRLLLENNENIRVVGEASNGQELLELLETTPTDLVLLDIQMPVMDGYETARQLKERYPKVKIMALSMMEEEPAVQRMLDAGATGYFLKSSGRSELIAAIKLVAGGDRFLCSSLAARLLNRNSKPVMETENKNQATSGPALSKREIEVLSLVAEGYTNAQIADKLFTSKRTIETHRQNILEKTKARNTAHLIKYGIQHGYINADY